MLADRFVQAIGARPRVTLEPFGYEAIRAANRQTFGRDAIPYYALQDAEVVISFGADFLETWLSNVDHARGFARMHTFRDGRAGTFFHVEPRQSLTASNADEWVRNAPGTEGAIALAIAQADAGRRPGRRQEATARRWPRRAQEGRRGERRPATRALERMAKAFGAAKPGLAIGGGVAVTGSQRHADPGRHQPAECGGR